MGPADPRTIEARRKLSVDPVLLMQRERALSHLSRPAATLPLFPLTGVVLLPRGQLPLNVFEPRYLELVDDALSGKRLIGMIQPTENEDKVAEAAAVAGRLRRPHHLLSRDRGQPLSDHADRGLPLPLVEELEADHDALSPGRVRFRALRRRPGADARTTIFRATACLRRSSIISPAAT